MHTMTTARRHMELRNTIEDAAHCYTLMIESGESPNIELMGYTSQMTIDTFRRLLDRPNLETDELASLLRQARRAAWLNAEARPEAYPKPVRVPKPVQIKEPGSDWSDMIAHYVIQQSNQN